MKLRALENCPNNLPGDIFELPEDVGKIFLSLKIAEKFDESKPPAPPKRQYRRRDLEAQTD